MPRLDLGARVVVLAGGGVAALPMMAIGSVLPQIAQALARSPGDAMLVRQLVGGVGLAMVMGASLVGFLMQALGLRRLLIGAALLYAAAGTAGLYLHDLPTLLASRLLLGLAAAAVQVSCMTMINTRLTGVVRDRWMGLHISSAMGITIVAHPLAGMLGTIGWRWPFALYAIGLLLIPAALSLPRTDTLAPSPPAIDAADRPRGWFPGRYVLLALVVGTAVFAPAVHAPFLLRDHGLASPALIALVLTADSLAGMVMSSLFGLARTRLSARQAFLISFAAASAGMAVAATAPGLPLVIAGLLIYGAGVGWFVPNMMTSLAKAVPPALQGRAVGFTKSAHYLAAPLGVAAMEPIAQRYGSAAVFGVVALMCLAALLIFATLGTRRARSTAGALAPEA